MGKTRQRVGPLLLREAQFMTPLDIVSQYFGLGACTPPLDRHHQLLSVFGGSWILEPSSNMAAKTSAV